MRFQERSELDIYYKPKIITKDKGKQFHISPFPYGKVPVPAQANYFTGTITVFERTVKYLTHDALHNTQHRISCVCFKNMQSKNYTRSYQN